MPTETPDVSAKRVSLQIAPGVYCTPTSLDFGNVTIGQQATLQLQCTNTTSDYVYVTTSTTGPFTATWAGPNSPDNLNTIVAQKEK
ncbi:MAG TPA: hypothetical protein VFB23_00850 [Candidatus Acidoferrales bacterium]|nr:hypothetical protein [Candidatus Acidoferrales bacterium]